MKVPKPRKLASGTWFIQMRLDGESVPVSAATRSECVDCNRCGGSRAAHPARGARIEIRSSCRASLSKSSRPAQNAPNGRRPGLQMQSGAFI